MQEPTIIDKLEKDPSEIPENPNLDIPKEKNIWGFIWILIVLVIIFPVVAFAYLYFTGKFDPFIERYFGGKGNQELTWNEWTGEYLKANLPEGWTVIENKLTGDEAEESEQNFEELSSGLMGFYIEDDDEKIVASVSYIIGPFCDPCPTNCTTLKFEDVTDTEINEYEEGLLEFAEAERCCSSPDYVDVNEYKEINFLDNKLRRVLDSSSDYLTEYLYGSGLVNVSCFDKGTLIGIENTDVTSFVLDIEDENISQETFNILDQILESFQMLEDDEISNVIDTTDWETYTNDTYKFSLKYPSDWEFSYVENDCPENVKEHGWCDNPEDYLYVLYINKEGYNFSLVQGKSNYAHGSAFVIYPDSEFIKDYQGCVGYMNFEDSVDLTSSLEGKFRRNKTWYEDNYGSGGFHVTYRSSDLNDDTNLYLLNMPLGDVYYETQANPDEETLKIMDQIFSSITMLEDDYAIWNTYTNDTYDYSLKYPSDWVIDIDNANLTEADGADIATLEIHFGLNKFVLSKWITGRGGQYCDFTDAPAPDELGGGGETILGNGAFVDNLESYRRNEDGVETEDGDYYYLVCKKNESEGETSYLGYSDLGEITYYLENESADVLEKMDEIFNSIELL